MSSDKMREAYEKYFHLPWGESDSDQEAWEACWIASRGALVIELPRIVGFEGAYDSFADNEFCPRMSDVEDADEIFGLCRSIEVREAIEAAGVQVKQ